MYYLFAHNSGNSVGIFAENELGEVVFEDVAAGETGYLIPLLNAVKNALETLDADLPLHISSPIINSLMRSAGDNLAPELRPLVREMLLRRKVTFEQIPNDHPKAIQAKRLARAKGRGIPRQHLSPTPSPNRTYDYIAYTDGSCNNLSPYGEGGAAYIIMQNGAELKRGAKGFIRTTNNRMEMLAIISAVAAIPEGRSILVNTDSQYCLQVFAPSYRIKQTTKNADLIELWRKISAQRDVSLSWVKGHAGNEFNELCDRLADSCTCEMRRMHNIPTYTTANSPKCNRHRHA